MIINYPFLVKCEKCGQINNGFEPYKMESGFTDVNNRLEKGLVNNPPTCSACGYVNYGHQSAYFGLKNKKRFQIGLALTLVICFIVCIYVFLKSGDADVAGVVLVLALIIVPGIFILSFIAHYRRKFERIHGKYERLPNNGLLRSDELPKTTIRANPKKSSQIKGGLLIGNGWLPEPHLIDKAIEWGAFGSKPDTIKVFQGIVNLDKMTAVYM